MTSRNNDRPPWRDDRVWQAGFLIGSALGAAATIAGRRAEKAARRGLVDWPEVERGFAIDDPLRYDLASATARCNPIRCWSIVPSATFWGVGVGSA